MGKSQTFTARSSGTCWLSSCGTGGTQSVVARQPMPSKPATVSSDSGGATRSSGLWAATKERGRRLIAEGLYRTRLLRTLERLAARHGIRRGAPSRLMRQTPGSKFGILCYHRVGTEGVPLFSRLEPKSFEAQMRYVKQHYRVVDRK